MTQIELALNKTKSRYFIEEASRLQTPTTGVFAAELHQWSNSSFVPETLARKTMQRAGYVPFAGYPLQRAK